MGALSIKQHTFTHWLRISVYKSDAENESTEVETTESSSSDEDHRQKKRGKLDWKNDVIWRLEGTDASQKTSSHLTATLTASTQDAHMRLHTYETREGDLRQSQYLDAEFMAERGRAVQQLSASLQMFGNQIVRTRGARLVDVLYRTALTVYAAVSEKAVRSVFRSLRMPMMEKRTLVLMNKSQLRNSIRIAKRFTIIERGMPVFRKQWVKQTFFRKWISWIGTKYVYETPHLGSSIQRRQVTSSPFFAIFFCRFLMVFEIEIDDKIRQLFRGQRCYT